MYRRCLALLMTFGLLAANGAAAAEPADDAPAGKTAAAKTAPSAAKAEEPAPKPPAVEAEPSPKRAPEQVSYEYVLTVLRALTEGSERRYAAMEEQIARLKSQIDELNRATESPAKKEAAKAPAVEPKVTPEAPSAKPGGLNAVTTPPVTQRPPAPKPPAWVGAGLQLVGNDYQVAAVIGPYSRPTEFEAERPVALREAVDCYVRRQLGAAAVGRIRLSDEDLRKLVRGEPWEVTEDFGAGPMKTRYELLVFDPAMQARIRSLWEGAVIARRLQYAATGLTGGLLLLGILFSCLKLDHSTAGRYRVRLIVAGVFLTGALTAGTIAAAQLLSDPATPTAAAAEAADSSQAHVAGEPGWLAPREDMDALPSAQETSQSGSAASPWIWIAAGVGLLGVLLLFSVGRKPSPPDALKETALHEVGYREHEEPPRRGGALLWIGLLLTVLVLLLASAFLFAGSSVKVQVEPAGAPARIESTPPASQPVTSDEPRGYRIEY